MFKNMIIIIVAAVFLSVGIGIELKTAKSAQGQPQDMSGGIIRVEEKIDALSQLIKEKDTTAISNKLDQILNNQNKIINELEVIKIRATRR